MSRIAPILSSVNSAPIVSVIIPTYRRWHLLCDAIESVMNQTHSCWEIIVVNDCGGEPEGRAKELLSDPRVKYLKHEQNLGLPAARNTAISASLAKYIAYLDDDDVYYEDHLEILVSVLEENEWDVAYTLAHEASYKFEGLSEQLIKKEIKYNSPFDRNRLWKENFIPVNCVMHRRNCFSKSGIFDTSLPLLEDWDLWLRMSLKYDFHMITKVTCEFRVRDEETSMTTTTTTDKWLKVKCNIFYKHILDQSIMSSKVARQLVESGISHFVSKKVPWLRNAFSETILVPVLIDLLKHVSIKTWLRMFIKTPVNTLYIAAVYLKKCFNSIFIPEHSSS